MKMIKNLDKALLYLYREMKKKGEQRNTEFAAR